MERSKESSQVVEVVPSIDDIIEQGVGAVHRMAAGGKDTAAMSPKEKEAVLAGICHALGLNPLFSPVQFLTLNGKQVLYATRGATDQLAAKHRLNREIIDGPKMLDLGGVKIGYCRVRVTHPDGRTEESTATLPWGDPANILMKLETKGKRRGTLSILGLGILDESELETIPGVELPAGKPASTMQGIESESRSAPRSTEPAPPMTYDVEQLCADIETRPGLSELAALWVAVRGDVGQWPKSHLTRAWDAAKARAEALGSSQAKLRAEIARQSPQPPSGGGGNTPPSAPSTTEARGTSEGAAAAPGGALVGRHSSDGLYLECLKDD